MLRLALRSVGEQLGKRVEEPRRVRQEVAAQVSRQQPREAEQRVEAERRLGAQARQQRVEERRLVVHEEREGGAQRVRQGGKGGEVRRGVELAPAQQSLLEEGLACGRGVAA